TDDGGGGGTGPTPVTKFTVAKTVSSQPAQGTAYALGEHVVFRIDVTNDGTSAGSTTVTETIAGEFSADGATGWAAGPTYTTTPIAPAGTHTVYFRHLVTQQDVDAGSVTNNVTTSDGGGGGTGPTPVTQFTVAKTVSSQPAHGTAYRLGEHIVYRIDVSNDGTSAGSTSVTETIAGEFSADGATGWVPGPTYTTPSIAPAGTLTVYFRHQVTAADVEAGGVTNAVSTGTGGGGGTGPTPASKFSVAKSVASQPAQGTAYRLGEHIVYKIDVANDGTSAGATTVTEAIAGEFSLDASFAAPTPGPTYTTSSIEPAGKHTVYFRHQVTHQDVEIGSVTNTVTTDTGGGDTEGPTPASKFSVAKSVASQPAQGTAYVLGEHIVYRIDVTNDGTSAGTATVTEALTGQFSADGATGWAAGPTYTTPPIAPGATATVYFRHQVTAADTQAGSVTNTVTTSTGDSAQAGPTASTQYTVAKSVLPFNGESPHIYAVGETVVYRIAVTNTGTLPVTSVRVAEEMDGSFTAHASGTSDGAIRPTFTINRILPGETVALTFTHVVTVAEVPYRLDNSVQVIDNADASVGNAKASTNTGYRIRYFGNGATAGITPADVYLLGSEKAVIAFGDSLARPGYVFLGWAESPYATTVSHIPGSTEFPTGNLDLYAVWSVASVPTPPAPPAAPAPIIVYPPAAAAPTVIVQPSNTVVERVVEVERQANESIPESQSPTANLGPQSPQGSWSLISLILSALAIILSALVLAGLLRRRDYEYLTDEEIRNLRRQRVFGVCAIVAGLLPVAIFLILDDLAQPMTLVTRSTVYVALAFILTVALVATYVALRRRREVPDTSDLYV
ncbi:MAG: DUF11 domain-containing protein, partial [Coriobacteriales bacterium]|nr:DUF11 domain-containing protein [Coriobacteriales bacterium]